MDNNYQGEPLERGQQPPSLQRNHQPYRNPMAEQPTLYPSRPTGNTQPAPPFNVGQSHPILSRPAAKRPRKRRKGCMITLLVVLVLLCGLGGFAAYATQRVLDFGSTISTQSPLSTQTNYMGISDRVNLLVMGYGGGSHEGAYLTDSLVVMSLLPQSQHTTIISIPRDLWIQYPPNSGQYTKINAIYETASNNNANFQAGGDAVAQKVSLVTGLTVKYWLTIDFDGFRKFIDAIGGVDVNIPASFKAQYPKNDDPAIDPSWKTVTFTKGLMHMNGETAIEYARARYVIDNLAEGTDFARSTRQQLIIKAALAKVKQVTTWPGLFGALDALKQTIRTNLSLADLAQFALKMDLNNARRVGLSNDNVLEDSTGPGGQYILLPRNSDWQLIVDYVKQNLFT